MHCLDARQSLEQYHDGDSTREAGHDGPGDVMHIASHSSERHEEEKKPGQERDGKESGLPVAGHNREQDDRHGAGGPAYLEVGSSEHGGDHAGHDGRGQTGGGPRTGGNTETQCQRKSHHGDGQPREQVLFQVTKAVIRESGKEAQYLGGQ